MINWMITGLLLAAIIALLALIWRARKEMAEMRSSVKETVEEALAKAELGFKSASNEALYKQQAEASESLDRTIGKSLAPVRDHLEKAKEEIEKFSQLAEKSSIKSGSAHDEVMRSISNLGTKAETLSDKADTLSDALRGDVKMMGDWGEHALEKILEIAGLEEGISYERQPSVETEEGKKQRPDVLVKLPKEGEATEKVLAIDSKVSLAGYMEYAKAGDDEEGRKAGIGKLVEAVKKQAAETAKYKKIEGRETPGFALMFMPIEPAWQLLQSHQKGKFVAEIQRMQGVVILGPSNLIVSLQMVAHLWRGYKQAANVEEFAATAGRIIDTFGLTVERLEKLKKAFATSQAELEDMEKSLLGKQGLEMYANKLKELGAKGKKEDDGG
ncbi:MAG: DNA recombination protein RmuC [Betaproteobacteria bacterium AqS2]|uniref:DNA recombination protein RmuC n=1 Tax=Candidatus Amphirhobacter heronislandensis TaxID=1732024 RepID=A0A930UH82_9GAMM|nr:DNA recombination protein RmuC [Betaproteobacteria bacterium AqS2]